MYVLTYVEQKDKSRNRLLKFSVISYSRDTRSQRTAVSENNRYHRKYCCHLHCTTCNISLFQPIIHHTVVVDITITYMITVPCLPNYRKTLIIHCIVEEDEDLQSWTKITAHLKYEDIVIDSVFPKVLKILTPPSPHSMYGWKGGLNIMLLKTAKAYMCVAFNTS